MTPELPREVVEIVLPDSSAAPLVAARGLVTDAAEAAPLVVEPAPVEPDQCPNRCDGPNERGPWHAARCSWHQPGEAPP